MRPLLPLRDAKRAREIDMSENMLNMPNLENRRKTRTDFYSLGIIELFDLPNRLKKMSDLRMRYGTKIAENRQTFCAVEPSQNKSRFLFISLQNRSGTVTDFYSSPS